MTHKRMSLLVCAVLASTTLFLGSCGKSGEEKEGGEAKSASEVPQVETEESISLDQAPMKDVLDAAGFEAAHYQEFPSQIPGLKSSVLIYKAKRGSDGGVIYLQRYGKDERIVWHWYFEDDVPQSLEAVELNGDGLWDVRMHGGDGTREFIQDESFSFTARQRDDRVALNGEASDPVGDEGESWRCFDGDSTTAWRSRASGAFVVIPTPLGIDNGVLTVQLVTEDQPRECELKVDGKKVQEFTLEQTTLEQVIQLEAAAREAKSLRLEVRSTHGGADDVAIAELSVN